MYWLLPAQDNLETGTFDQASSVTRRWYLLDLRLGPRSVAHVDHSARGDCCGFFLIELLTKDDCKMTTLLRITAVLLPCLWSQVTLAQTEFEREVSFPAVHGSYSQLFAVIERIRTFVNTANNGTDKNYESESLRASAPGMETKLQRGFTHQDFAGAPEIANDIWYSYSLSKAPIGQIEIRLGDYTRSATVSSPLKISFG
jgi:hypothetical protein